MKTVWTTADVITITLLTLMFAFLVSSILGTPETVDIPIAVHVFLICLFYFVIMSVIYHIGNRAGAGKPVSVDSLKPGSHWVIYYEVFSKLTVGGVIEGKGGIQGMFLVKDNNFISHYQNVGSPPCPVHAIVEETPKGNRFKILIREESQIAET